ncbi:MAG TPA: asparagine synthase-related protein [Chloroflexota bacterium]|nr:asparagine synthase-related protein [Chloroflexota bacterium]
MRLLGYWGIPRDAEIYDRLRLITSGAGPRKELRGQGWCITAIPNNHARERTVATIIDDNNVRGLMAGRLFSQGGENLSITNIDVKQLTQQPLPVIAKTVWGSYLAAAVPSGDAHLVLARDPVGLGCGFIAHVNAGAIFGSQLSDVVHLLGAEPSINWSQLVTWISHGYLPSDATAIQGIMQVPAGTALIIGREGSRQSTYWHPAAIASERRTVEADSVREAFRSCVTAWIGQAPKVYVDLSGGLDSSAIAWAASSSGRPVSAGYIDYGMMAAADELPYARQVADQFDIQLERISGIEVLPLAPARQSLLRLNAPTSHILQARLNEVQSELAGTGSVSLCGGGGDQAFYARLEMPWQLHDHLAQGTIGRYFGQLAVASRREGIPLVKLISATVGSELYRWFRPASLCNHVTLTVSPPAWLRAEHRCSEDCSRHAARQITRGGRRLPAGKLRHAIELGFSVGMVDREYRPSLEYPMLSQPLVELALSTPLHELISSDQDRILFRNAMHGVLPAAVVARQEKGDYTGMYQLGLQRYFAHARELIMDGRAAALGIVDGPQAVAELRVAALGHSVELWPLLHLLSVELWCRSWS